MLILYPTNLLNSFINSNSLCVCVCVCVCVYVKPLAFSIHKVMMSVNRDSFVSSYLVWVCFISFLCLIALAGTFNKNFLR